MRATTVIHSSTLNFETSVAKHVTCRNDGRRLCNNISCDPVGSIDMLLKNGFRKIDLKCTCRVCANNVNTLGNDRRLILKCGARLGLFGGKGGGRGDMELLW